MLLIIKSWPVCIYATLDPTILLNIYRQNTKWWGSELDGNFMWTLFFLIWYFSKPRQRPWFANSTVLQADLESINGQQWATVKPISVFSKIPQMLINSILLKILIHIYKCLLGLGNVLSSSQAHLIFTIEWDGIYIISVCRKERLEVVWYNVLHVTGGKTWREVSQPQL